MELPVKEGKSSAHLKASRASSSPPIIKQQIGCLVKDFTPSDWMDGKDAKRQGRYTQFAMAATKLALDDAKMDTEALDKVCTPDALSLSRSSLGVTAHAPLHTHTILVFVYLARCQPLSSSSRSCRGRLQQPFGETRRLRCR